jgi:hypothetical protein
LSVGLRGRRAKIVINCEPTYTPVRGGYRVAALTLCSNRNYSEI